MVRGDGVGRAIEAFLENKTQDDLPENMRVAITLWLHDKASGDDSRQRVYDKWRVQGNNLANLSTRWNTLDPDQWLVDCVASCRSSLQCNQARETRPDTLPLRECTSSIVNGLAVLMALALAPGNKNVMSPESSSAMTIRELFLSTALSVSLLLRSHVQKLAPQPVFEVRQTTFGQAKRRAPRPPTSQVTHAINIRRDLRIVESFVRLLTCGYTASWNSYWWWEDLASDQKTNGFYKDVLVEIQTILVRLGQGVYTDVLAQSVALHHSVMLHQAGVGTDIEVARVCALADARFFSRVAAWARDAEALVCSQKLCAYMLRDPHAESNNQQIEEEHNQQPAKKQKLTESHSPLADAQPIIPSPPRVRETKTGEDSSDEFAESSDEPDSGSETQEEEASAEAHETEQANIQNESASLVLNAAARPLGQTVARGESHNLLKEKRERHKRVLALKPQTLLSRIWEKLTWGVFVA